MNSSTENLGRIVRAIALQMDGYSWSHAPKYHPHGPPTQYIVHKKGPKLHFRIQKQRLHISGCFPSAPDGTHFTPLGTQPRITVSPDRDSFDIVKDIHRRLLTDYLPAYFDAVDRRREYLHQQDRQTEIVLQLARALQAEVQPGRNEVYVPGHLPHYGRFRVTHPGEVEILRLSRLTLDQALQIAQILTSRQEDNRS